MWQQHSNSVTPTFPTCALSGKANSKRERARIADMWRELLVRRSQKKCWHRPSFLEMSSAERAINPARMLQPEALGPRGCFGPSWHLASEAARVAPQSGSNTRAAPVRGGRRRSFRMRSDREREREKEREREVNGSTG